MPQAIDHIAIIVPNLEEAIERWSLATGYQFSPIARYRTTHYVDYSSAEPHLHDARQSLSLQGSPRIELMEATGEGSHSMNEAGFHHIGFLNIPDIEEALVRREGAGFPVDVTSYTPDGRLHLFFTSREALDGVRVEFCSDRTPPIVADDGGPLAIDPTTNRPSVLTRRVVDESVAEGASR